MSNKKHNPKFVNKTILQGRIGKDPVLRKLPSGDFVINFAVATRDDSGSHVEWHNIVAFDGLAEYANETFNSGDFVYVEGAVKTREFLTAEDKEKNRKPRKVKEIIACDLHLIAKKASQLDPEIGNDKEENVSYSPIETPSLDENSIVDNTGFQLPSYV
jgi:single-strand DNA-binding protein